MLATMPKWLLVQHFRIQFVPYNYKSLWVKVSVKCIMTNFHPNHFCVNYSFRLKPQECMRVCARVDIELRDDSTGAVKKGSPYLHLF